MKQFIAAFMVAALLNGSALAQTVGPAPSSGGKITSTSATCLTVGPNGTTNPVLSADCSIASSATGIKVVPAAAGSGVTLQATSSATNDGAALAAAGNGTASIKSGSSSVNVNSQGSGNFSLVLGGSTTISHNGFTLTDTSFTNNAAAFDRWVYNGPADTNLTASVEAQNVDFNLSQTRQHATGALALQRDFLIKPATHSFVGASTLTEASTFSTTEPLGGTNATLTEADALYVPTVAATNTTTAAGAHLIAPTGASNNWALDTSGAVIMTNLGTVTAGTNGAMCLSSAGQLGANAANCIASRLEWKTDIRPLEAEDALDEIGGLAKDAISYRYTDEYLGEQKDELHSRDRQVGFGAEWVEKTDPRFAQYGKDGKLSGVRYEQMTALEAVAIAELRYENLWLKLAVITALAASGASLYRTRNI